MSIILEPVTPQLIEKIENNKKYKDNERFSIPYFYVERSLYKDPNFMDKICEFGFAYLGFLEYLKSKMMDCCKYYIYEKHINMAIREFSIMYEINSDLIEKIYNDLVENNYITIIQCSCIKEPIITEPGVVYSYRLVNEKRAYNRKKEKSTYYG